MDVGSATVDPEPQDVHAQLGRGILLVIQTGCCLSLGVQVDQTLGLFAQRTAVVGRDEVVDRQRRGQVGDDVSRRGCLELLQCFLVERVADGDDHAVAVLGDGQSVVLARHRFRYEARDERFRTTQVGERDAVVVGDRLREFVVGDLQDVGQLVPRLLGVVAQVHAVESRVLFWERLLDGETQPAQALVGRGRLVWRVQYGRTSTGPGPEVSACSRTRLS